MPQQKHPHSEGPWDYEAGDPKMNGMSTIFRTGDREFIIGYFIFDSRNEMQRKEDLANVRLATRSPDMYDILSRMNDIASQSELVEDLESGIRGHERETFRNLMNDAKELFEFLSK